MLYLNNNGNNGFWSIFFFLNYFFLSENTFSAVHLSHLWDEQVPWSVQHDILSVLLRRRDLFITAILISRFRFVIRVLIRTSSDGCREMATAVGIYWIQLLLHRKKCLFFQYLTYWTKSLHQKKVLTVYVTGNALVLLY